MKIIPFKRKLLCHDVNWILMNDRAQKAIYQFCTKMQLFVRQKTTSRWLAPAPASSSSTLWAPSPPLPLPLGCVIIRNISVDTSGFCHVHMNFLGCSCLSMFDSILRSSFHRILCLYNCVWIWLVLEQDQDIQREEDWWETTSSTRHYNTIVLITTSQSWYLTMSGHSVIKCSDWDFMF